MENDPDTAWMENLAKRMKVMEYQLKWSRGKIYNDFFFGKIDSRQKLVLLENQFTKADENFRRHLEEVIINYDLCDLIDSSFMCICGYGQTTTKEINLREFTWISECMSRKLEAK